MKIPCSGKEGVGMERNTPGRCLEDEAAGLEIALKGGGRCGQRVGDIQVSSGARTWASMPPPFPLLPTASSIWKTFIIVSTPKLSWCSGLSTDTGGS